MLVVEFCLLFYCVNINYRVIVNFYFYFNVNKLKILIKLRISSIMLLKL